MEDTIDLYADSANMNLINICKPLLNMGWYLDNDGKLKTPTKIATNIPWIFASQDDTRKCDLWHGVFFNVFGWLPSACLSCWKVVVRPKTLEDLFNLHEMQKEMGLSSKCGIEVRDTVFGLYGGYFYADTQVQGAMIYEEVAREVQKRLAEGTPVIFKRGCTEFEHKYGDSANWQDHVTEEQIHMERRLDRFLETHEKIPQPEVVKHSIYKRWIEYAYSHGDPTYRKFTGGKDLFTPYRTYNDAVPEILYGQENHDPERGAGAEHEEPPGPPA